MKAYQVDKIQVITSKNISAVKIEKGRDLVKLLTCTPYMINTHQLLVTGHRIPYHPKEAKKEEQNEQMKAWLKLAYPSLLGLDRPLYLVEQM